VREDRGGAMVEALSGLAFPGAWATSRWTFPMPYGCLMYKYRNVAAKSEHKKHVTHAEERRIAWT
jgi:hypothetical protein